MTEFLFSYGTLQLEKVQLSSFGRILKGDKDALIGYSLSQVEITDEAVLAQSEQRFHPVAIPSANREDKVEGVVFEITPAELLKADAYEVDDYARVAVTLSSGKKAWVYILKEYAQ
ncbi:gamma-glutamylcyclotransferase family protein [Mucilaginibacter sp. dw_454]|uniref:gamma-glutamylcyclotransferase family protein n=1 Tax=Mucilaginibacter sp. dw_454 TaxID=2720079 RepID=UPI001BD5511F|nr:gamma-glutamylcyclotransferase family protein [Mucilaginibacter sp. dw_454]